MGISEKDFNVKFRSKNFKNADLRGYHFEAMDLKLCDFTGADLTNCVFTGSDMRGCFLNMATLTGVVPDDRYGVIGKYLADMAKSILAGGYNFF